MSNIPVIAYKVDSLVGAKPNAFLYRKVEGENKFEIFVTDLQGVPYSLKGGSGSSLQTIVNSDGTLTISGSSIIDIKVSDLLQAIINSALQNGDNISNLINDVGYITSTSLPTTTSDLINDGADGVNPFVTQLDVDSIGYELKSNKVTDFTIVNDILYPTVEAVSEQLVIKADKTTTISTISPLLGGGNLSTNRTLSISQATTSTNGYLTSTDWNTFNNKQDTITLKTVGGQSLIGSGNVTEVQNNLTGSTILAPSVTAVNGGLSLKVDANSTIAGATKTKITYDSKGLVTAGVDATTADINDSLNRRYITDSDLIDINNLSGINTGDETTAAIQSKRPLKTIEGQSLEGVGDIQLTTSDISSILNKRYVTDNDLINLSNLSGVNSGDNAINTTSNTYADSKIIDSIADADTTHAPSRNAVYDALSLKQDNLTIDSVPIDGSNNPVTSNGVFDAINTAVEGVVTKGDCVIATTANIILSGLQTIDGVLTIAGDRILVKDQSTQSQNGIYISAVGSWTRSNDANTGLELVGAMVSVDSGTVNFGTTWRQTSSSIVLGSTNIVWVQFGASTPDATPTVKGKLKLYTALGTQNDGIADNNTVKAAIDLKEDTLNKTDDIETNKTSSTKFTSAKSIVDWVKTYFFGNIPAKATALVDADLILLGDSEDSNKSKTRTWSQIKTNLASIFQYKLTAGTNITIDNTNPLTPIINATVNLNTQMMNASSFEAYGDSITVGMNSSPTNNSYVNLLTGLYSKTVVNRAVSGRGIWESCKQHFANITTTSTALAIVMAGFNDVRRGGSATKTRNKIINGYKSILANHFLGSFIAAGTTSTSIVRVGSWTNTYSGISVGCKTNTGSFSNTNGNYIEYTFTNNNVVLGLVAADGTTNIYADFTVLIDGVSQGSFSENNQTDAISDGSNDNARSAMCLIFSGLTDATHTIRLTNTTTAYLVVDYFGHLKQPKFCYPILVMQAPKMDATGYAISPNSANDTVINQLNTDILSVVSSFPSNYPILVAETNSYYNVATGLDTSDHIHPNNVGHRQIYQAAYTALKPLLLGGSLGTTDSLQEGTGNLYFTTARVLATVITGVSFATSTAITAADTVLIAFGKLQKQITDLITSVAGKLNVAANTSLAGTGTRMMEATSDGTPIATYIKYQMKVSDSDVISAITGATYTLGVATITPTSSKIMYEGQVYQSGTYFYRAYSDNVVLRSAVV